MGSKIIMLIRHDKAMEKRMCLIKIRVKKVYMIKLTFQLILLVCFANGLQVMVHQAGGYHWNTLQENIATCGHRFVASLQPPIDRGYQWSNSYNGQSSSGTSARTLSRQKGCGAGSTSR